MAAEQKMKVLVVDDEKLIRDFLSRLLCKEGCDVMTAENGFQAVSCVQQEKFRLVFLDVRMPRMNGVETLKELKKIAPETKYVMMTGYAVEDLLREAQKEGIVLSLQKPFDIPFLVKFVRECLPKA